MKFFTPDLYRRFNSPDDAVADLADDEWGRALHAYRDSLSPHLDAMSPRVRQLAEGRDGLCFHDAELLAIREEDAASPPDSPFPPVALVSLADEGTITDLVYSRWAPVEQSPAPGDWPFSASRTYWLDDEIHVDAERSPPAPARYRHEVLLSGGRIVSIPFSDVIIHRYSLPHPEPVVITRRRA